MKPLDTQRLLLNSPYTVESVGDEYRFKTDYNILYAVSFKEEEFFSPIPAYWFDLSNRSHRASPNDPNYC